MGGKGTAFRPEVVLLSIPPRPDPARLSYAGFLGEANSLHSISALEGELELMRKWNS